MKSGKYEANKVEKKWQKFWADNKTFEAKNSGKKKFYGLIEFPYPSGDGLHTGHLRSNTAIDIISRKRRMEGYNVLYPIGMDAFGLPAENYAVKHKVPPQVTTKKNIETFTKQLKESGFSFDWSRFLSTTDKDYYRWTQWIFIKMWEQGLAYKASENINWCPSCKIGLANEEVVNGTCERCGSEVEKRQREQWMLKITKYADRLIKGLDNVDYLERIKTQQKNWVGKSEGAEIDFQIEDQVLKVFTTRPDTIFGATFMVIAPEHPIIHELEVQIKNISEIKKYVQSALKKTDMERGDVSKGKNGVELKGIKAKNPATKKDIPVFVADYVMMNYGTGAIMAVPAHDERDYEFAKKYKLPIVEVVSGGDIKKEAYTDNQTGKLVNSGKFNGQTPKKAFKEITKFVGGKIKTNYKLRDWIFSRQRYWGEPIPMVHCEACVNKKYRYLLIHGYTGSADVNFFPWLKKELEKKGHEVYAPNLPNTKKPKVQEQVKAITDNFKIDKDTIIVGHSLGGVVAMRILEKLKAEVHKTVFVDSFIRPEFNDNERFEVEDSQNWKFDFKAIKRACKKFVVLADESFCTIPEEQSYEMQELFGARLNFTKSEEEHYCAEIEPDVLTEAIEDGWQPVPEKDLPVELPDIKDFMPTADGASPLAKVDKWVKTKCPNCGGAARRETDVMPNWAGSNWYFIRYTDPKNDKQLVDPKIAKYWLPVDWYNGGMEHTTLHLLYSRFVFKFLFDIGVIPKEVGDEPYAKRTAHGLILAGDGSKMSKSKGNVVNPDELVAEYGADAVRCYEMFMGPFDQEVAWDTKGLVGVRRFLDKVWKTIVLDKDKAIAKDENDKPISTLGNSEKDILKSINVAIKKVTDDIESMKFNTAISSLMICINEISRFKVPNMNLMKEIFEKYTLILSPFAPHMAEEMWQQLGHKQSLAKEAWPKFDAKLATSEKVTIGIQVNGKLRDTIELDQDEDDQKKVESAVLKMEKIQNSLGGKKVAKFIFVKNKIISIVAK